MSMVGTQKTGVSGNMSRPSQQAAILADRIGDEAADVHLEVHVVVLEVVGVA